VTDRLSTGLGVLDRNLRGGVPAGSLVALVAPPESQSELLLEAVATAGPSLYLANSRTAEGVESSLDHEALTARGFDHDAVRENVSELLDRLPERGYLVLDAAEPFERLDPDAQQAALTALSNALRENQAVGVVHCLGTRQDAPRRRTLRRADHVWTLDLVRGTLSIENRLYVTKARNDAALTEPVKLRLTDQVTIDTSRDIA
jgi:DNA repair protein RadA/Sms